MVKNQPKRNKRKRPTSKKYKFYTIEGDTVVKKKSCPRCGPGVFLAEAKDRTYCGRCHYTEFATKDNQAKEQEKSSEKKEK